MKKFLAPALKSYIEEQILPRYAADDSGGHLSGKERIFREVFKISAAQRISVNVHTWCKQNIRSPVKHLCADKSIKFFNKLGVLSVIATRPV